MPKQTSEQAKAVKNSAPRGAKPKMSSEGLQDRASKKVSRDISNKSRNSSKKQN